MNFRENDENYWRSFVKDAEYQAEINESDETLNVFNSFLKYFLKAAATRQQQLYLVKEFNDLEFMITPDEEFYVSAKIVEVINLMIAKLTDHDLRDLSTSLIITDN